MNIVSSGIVIFTDLDEKRKSNHLETLEEVAWQFFCPHLWPLPPYLNLPTVNYIIAAEFVDFLHIKSKSLKKKSAKVSPIHAKSSISFRRNYVVCLCAFPTQKSKSKKTLGKQNKKIEKIIIAIVSASNILQKKKKNDGRCRQAWLLLRLEPLFSCERL